MISFKKLCFNYDGEIGLLINKARSKILPLHQSSKSPISLQDFQFGGPSGSGGNSGGGGSGSSSNGGKVPPLIREFLSSLDDKEWQSELYKLLQNQSFNQVEVDLFELLCKVLDHNLFAQVDWARNSYYFKELKVGSRNNRTALNPLTLVWGQACDYCQELLSIYSEVRYIFPSILRK